MADEVALELVSALDAVAALVQCPSRVLAIVRTAARQRDEASRTAARQGDEQVARMAREAVRQARLPWMLYELNDGGGPRIGPSNGTSASAASPTASCCCAPGAGRPTRHAVRHAGIEITAHALDLEADLEDLLSEIKELADQVAAN